MDDLLHNPDCEKYRDRYTLRKKENELLCRRGFSHNCAAVFIFTKSAAGEAKTPCREVFPAGQISGKKEGSRQKSCHRSLIHCHILLMRLPL